LDFSTNFYRFSKLADLTWGNTDIVVEKTLERKEDLQLGPWSVLNRGTERRWPNSGEGKVVEKVQGLTADSGMTGIKEERRRGDGSTEVRAGAAKFREWRWRSGGWNAGGQWESGQKASTCRCGAGGELGEGYEGAERRDDCETERRRWKGSLAPRSGWCKRERMEKNWLGSFGGMWRCQGSTGLRMWGAGGG
jgi:hypothetical protein